VIVVDDGSPDDTGDIARSYGAQVIRQDNAGPAVARNTGIARAQGDIVLFTDADCIPAPDWVAAMLAPFTDPSVMGAKGVYRTRQRGLVPRFVQLEYETRYDQMAHQVSIDFVDTYAAAYRRSVLLEYGCFDTSFPTASVEDQELSFRLAERGLRLVFAPQAIVYHQHPPTLRHYLRRKFKTAYWKTLVLRQHPEKVWRDSHTPQRLKLEIALVYGMLPAILLGWLFGLALPLALTIATTLAISYAPFIAKAACHDPPVALVAPGLLTCRALALGAGLLCALVDSLRGRGPLTQTKSRTV